MNCAYKFRIYPNKEQENKRKLKQLIKELNDSQKNS